MLICLLQFVTTSLHFQCASIGLLLVQVHREVTHLFCYLVLHSYYEFDGLCYCVFVALCSDFDGPLDLAVVFIPFEANLLFLILFRVDFIPFLVVCNSI